ncbi:olfactory receptor 8G17-like [Cololabis saira]|uniref:olfactory receptor 8G17-like n=1 Tax=Cololabis saira TaxID=129043 RepID=UPI002AD2D48C|nr:olfactory receptor 8G17-like [Cololabis saira]
MENSSFNSLTLQLEGLNISKDAVHPVFVFFLFFYIFIMMANASIAILILVEKSLHQPMYLLFCNLPFNDMMGNTMIVPRLLADILRPPSERLIGFHECVLQAFIIHLFATSSHTVLMIMAFDRYVAICRPLRYASIMTTRMVVKLTASAWGLASVWIVILIGLTVRLTRCRTLIMNPYCDNASLFKLSCESVFVNNMYGYIFAVVLFSSSVGSVALTYARITVACLTSNNKSLNSKALKTCSTHLVLYLILLVSGLTVIILHRFPQFSEQRKLMAILLQIIPSSLNPIIYGVQSAEIIKSISKLIRSKSVPLV